MNKTRRNAITKIIDSIQDARATIQAERTTYADWETVVRKLEDLIPDVASVEEIRDEEQEPFDNLPEGLQSSERGNAMEEAISNLDSAIDGINELSDKFEDAPEENLSPDELDVFLGELVDSFDEALDEISDFLTDASA